MIILTINFNFVNPLIKNAKLLLYLLSTYTILLFYENSTCKQNFTHKKKLKHFCSLEKQSVRGYNIKNHKMLIKRI